MITVRVYDDYNSIALQAVDTNDLEGCEFSKKCKTKSSGNMKKLMVVSDTKSSKLLENPVTLPLQRLTKAK